MSIIIICLMLSICFIELILAYNGALEKTSTISLVFVNACLILANIDLLGLDFHFNNVNSLFITFNLSFIISSLLMPCKKTNTLLDINVEERWIKAFWVISLCSIIINIPICLKAFDVFSNIPSYEYRRLVLKSESPLFPFSQAIIFYRFFLMGSEFISIMLGVVLFVATKQNRYILIPLIIAIMMSFIFMGRFPIYRVFALTCIALVSVNRLNVFKLAVVSSILLGLMLAITTMRGSGGDIVQALKSSLIGYHTYGFILLENYMINNDWSFENSWFGASILPSFFYFINLPFSLLFGSKSYMQTDYQLQDKFIYFGGSDLGYEVNINAFYTFIFEPYLDFGYIGVAAYGAIAAILIQQTRKSDSVGSKVLLMFINTVIFFGMFINFLSEHGTTFVILFLIFMKAFSKNEKSI